MLSTLCSALISTTQPFTVIEQPTMMIMGIECRTSNKHDAGPIDIPKHWGTFFTEHIADKIPNKTSPEIIALYCDYEGDYTQPYSLVIGCQVSSSEQIPDGMVVKTLPATSYAAFSAVGPHPQSLIDTWGKIWQTDLKRTYTGDFEYYGEKFSADPQEVYVLIAIE